MTLTIRPGDEVYLRMYTRERWGRVLKQTRTRIYVETCMPSTGRVHRTWRSLAEVLDARRSGDAPAVNRPDKPL